MRTFLILIRNYILSNIFRQNPFWKEKQYINQYLPANPVILEAGAHIGSDTMNMAWAWKGSIIHAFEPIPAIYSKLQGRVKYFSKVKTYPVALGASTGNAKIFVSRGSSDASSSLLSPKAHLETDPGVFFEEEIVINTITLDDWAAQNNIGHLDFMWLDMQGFELAALKSGTTILKTVKAIYTEVFFTELYENAPLYPEVRAWFETQGFVVAREEFDWVNSGNVLFVRKELLR